jgi:hypothetical protein
MMSELEEAGFEKQILKILRKSQPRKYFLQQTAASVAMFIVSQRHPTIAGQLATLRSAHQRLFGIPPKRLKRPHQR